MKKLLLSTLLLTLLITTGCQKDTPAENPLGEPPVVDSEPNTSF